MNISLPPKSCEFGPTKLLGKLKQTHGYATMKHPVDPAQQITDMRIQQRSMEGLDSKSQVPLLFLRIGPNCDYNTIGFRKHFNNCACQNLQPLALKYSDVPAPALAVLEHIKRSMSNYSSCAPFPCSFMDPCACAQVVRRRKGVQLPTSLASILQSFHCFSEVSMSNG